MSTEPESLVLQLRRDRRAEMATKADILELRSELRSEIHSLRADVASDVIDVRRKIAGVCRELGEQIVGPRRAVVEYHTSMVGHGDLISELEAASAASSSTSTCRRSTRIEGP